MIADAAYLTRVTSVLARICDKRGKAMYQILKSGIPVVVAVSPTGTETQLLFLLGDRPFNFSFTIEICRTDYGPFGVPLTGVFISLAFPPIFHHISCSRGRPGTLREAPSC